MGQKFISGYAHIHECAAVSNLLVETAYWMERHKRPIWSPDRLKVDFVKPYIEAGQCLVSRFNEAIVGTSMLEWQDLEFWPDHNDQNAGYIHKLAVRRDFASTGVSDALISLAQEKAIVNNRRYLRLDCDPEIGKIYERLGFTKLDQKKMTPFHREEFVVSRYQKEI